MKRATFYLSVLMLGVFLAFVSGCTTTPEESCEQEEICTGKTITACCNEDECYYEFNGVKYGTDAASKLQLATDLGCAQASLPTYKEDISDLILRIEALGEFVKTNKRSTGE